MRPDQIRADGERNVIGPPCLTQSIRILSFDSFGFVFLVQNFFRTEWRRAPGSINAKDFRDSAIRDHLLSLLICHLAKRKRKATVAGFA